MQPVHRPTSDILRIQLSYVRRDLGYLEKYMEKGYAPVKKEIPFLLTIMKLYEQQLYMYENKTHTVEHRIVSISQPWLRPIVRGKVKAPVEFGAKLDLSIDEKGYSRIEQISFEAYNESIYLQEAVMRYYNRTGHYPERILVDQIYRTRENQLTSIALSVFTANLFKMQRRILCALLNLLRGFPEEVSGKLVIVA